MNAERLLAHYERIADAPDAIPRLRQFVLTLAVRGKLLPQNPSDEPASQFLNRIPSLPKPARYDKRSPELIPGDCGLSINHPRTHLPHGWLWVPLVQIARLESGHTPSRNRPEWWGGDVPWIGLVDARLHNNGTIFKTIQTTNEQGLANSAARLLPKGTVCFSRTASVGYVVIMGRPMATSQDFVNWVPTDAISSSWLQLVLIAERPAIDRFSKGAVHQTIYYPAWLAMHIALPPLAEQRRIVAKVDELMALCDRLEAARAEREATRDRFGAASLGRLNAPDPDTFRDDIRFTLDALPALTARPGQIKQLLQTILNLAVAGKLVRHDANDEPVSELLKRIAAAKAERKKKTGDARIKMEPDPKSEDLPMLLPEGWVVQSFENLFLFIDYRGNTPPKTSEGIPLITAKNVRMGHLNREPREYISKSTFKTWMTRGFPEIGDLFFTTEAPLANICLNDIKEPFALAQRIICLQPYASISTRFVMFALMSDVMQSLIAANATGLTAKGIKAAKLKPLPIRL